jgi:hypothetical protein
MEFRTSNLDTLVISYENVQKCEREASLANIYYMAA